MFCQNCGMQMNEGATFCSRCGQYHAPAQAQPVVNVPPVDATFEEKKDALGGSILKWGILSVVFAETFFLSLLGFIFSFKASSLVGAYEMQFGPLKGRALAGKILSIIGRITGLILTIFATLYFVVLFVLLAQDF